MVIIPPACSCLPVVWFAVWSSFVGVYNSIDETHPTNHTQSAATSPADTSVNQSLRSIDMTHDEVTDHIQ